jgi:urease beta subunit
MKKSFRKILGLAFVAALILAGCNNDDPIPEPLPPVLENLEKGIMDGELSENYTLNPSKQYILKGSFIVPEGIELTIPAGTNIQAEAGGTDVYLAVLMGGKIFINGTENSPVVMSSVAAQPGDWGGLTICGKGITSAGENAEAEVGGFRYGGTDAGDNSGVVKYLVIKGTGAQINSESQYNGVSLYAVGSETLLENIAVINGADDGIEFFGGSASVTNLFLQNNEDDAIDWTEGWNGTVTNSYIEHTIEDFSTVVEADKANGNPKLVNLTAVSTKGGIALQFKKESGATITGLSLAGYSTSIDMKDNGPLENVIIEGEVGDPGKSYNNPPTVDPTSWTWVGAELAEIVVLEGELAGELTLDASKSYRLKGSYIVKDGGKLTIPAGTKIHADAGGTDVYLAVLMGGQIFINGTAENPVVMASDLGQPADWGGLTICGRGITTAGENAEAEVGGFKYGGTDNTDNSGSVTYLVIRGTGAQINSESQYNGVSLYAVGSATKLENISVINGADDGIEFFGGAATVTNIYLENNEDDAVDWTEGWNGGITNTYISHTIEGFSTAFEGDKVNNNPKFTNVTCISTVGGIALQFKKESGASITGLHINGYAVELDMKDGGALSNVKVDGADANATLISGQTNQYKFNSGANASPIDISAWTWKDANL